MKIFKPYNIILFKILFRDVYIHAVFHDIYKLSLVFTSDVSTNASTSTRIKICPFCVIALVLALVPVSLVKTRLLRTTVVNQYRLSCINVIHKKNHDPGLQTL